MNSIGDDMPELPEVETVVRQLSKALVGRVIVDVVVLREKSFDGDPQQLIGKRIETVERTAKMIVVSFNNFDTKLVGHLKMTGQMVWREAKPILNTQYSKLKAKLVSAVADDLMNAQQIAGGHPTGDWVNALPSRHTRVMLNFDDGSTLYFNDQRVFGWLKVMDNSEFINIVERLPPDVVDDAFTEDYLWGQLQRSSRAIKLILLDQQRMGGLGNIYVNDALWKASISPERPSNSLHRTESNSLHRAIVEVIERAISLKGSTYSHFVDVSGMGGSYQDEFLVYDREGENCLRDGCDEIIAKGKLGGRGTYWCPACQR